MFYVVFLYYCLDDFIYWLIFFLEVLLLDSWERFRVEGYVYIIIFSKVGKRGYVYISISSYIL